MREKLQNFISSAHIMLYPKFMLINKTNTPFISGKQTFLPFSNEYLSPNDDRISFKIPGYRYSPEIDLKTASGLRGSL